MKMYHAERKNSHNKTRKILKAIVINKNIYIVLLL